MNKLPSCVLYNWTPRPLETVWLTWQFAKDPNFTAMPTVGLGAPDQWAIDADDERSRMVEYAPTLPSREELVSFFEKLVKDYTQIPEFITFNFACTNIPRAMMDQITRHRRFSFFVQSLRVVDAGQFAEESDYFTPPSVDENEEIRVQLDYKNAMHSAAVYYKTLVAAGVPLEDARGVLPLHLNTKMCIAMNLRAFIESVQTRSCHLLQQVYWKPLLGSMREQLVSKVDPALDYIFEPPCKFHGRCLSPIEQQMRVEGKDPHEPCSLYRELFGA